MTINYIIKAMIMTCFIYEAAIADHSPWVKDELPLIVRVGRANQSKLNTLVKKLRKSNRPKKTINTWNISGEVSEYSADTIHVRANQNWVLHYITLPLEQYENEGLRWGCGHVVLLFERLRECANAIDFVVADFVPSYKLSSEEFYNGQNSITKGLVRVGNYRPQDRTPASSMLSSLLKTDEMHIASTVIDEKTMDKALETFNELRQKEILMSLVPSYQGVNGFNCETWALQFIASIGVQGGHEIKYGLTELLAETLQYGGSHP